MAKTIKIFERSRKFFTQPRFVALSSPDSSITDCPSLELFFCYSPYSFLQCTSKIYRKDLKSPTQQQVLNSKVKSHPSTKRKRSSRSNRSFLPFLPPPLLSRSHGQYHTHLIHSTSYILVLCHHCFWVFPPFSFHTRSCSFSSFLNFIVCPFLFCSCYNLDHVMLPLSNLNLQSEKIFLRLATRRRCDVSSRIHFCCCYLLRDKTQDFMQDVVSWKDPE